MKDSSSCVISRFGPYSPFFHFPHQNDQELGALYDWGWGITNTLVGYEAYAWGGPTVLTSDCAYTRTVEITTSIQAGSQEAFATYLHSLGDSYSHRDCLAALEGVSPWGTHTLIGTKACDYIPTNPNNRDAHGREFGTQSMTDSLRTDEGVFAIYSELTARSLQGEGIYPPLGLDDPLPGVDGASTLREALYYFIHTWEFEPVKPGDPEFAENRRNYAAMIAAAALAQRHKLHLPMVIRRTSLSLWFRFVRYIKIAPIWLSLPRQYFRPACGTRARVSA